MNEICQFDYSALEGRIKQYYDTQENFANEIPMARCTLNQKINGNADFTSQNIYRICKLLKIPLTEIDEYFFKEKV